MKKILLTLFAVAAVFVACDKDGLDQEITNINVVEQAEEINASVEIDESIMQGLLSLDFSSNKGSVNTGRTTRPAAADVNGLYLNFYTEGGNNYVSFTSDDVGQVCHTGTTQQRLYSLEGNDLKVYVGDGTTAVVTLTDITFAFLFAIDNFRVVYQIDSEFLIQSSPAYGTFTFSDCAGGTVEWTQSSTTAGLWEHPTYGSYQLSNAPFPLSGVLARVMSEGTDVSGTLNYAASGSMTDNAAVREAIENDFEN